VALDEIAMSKGIDHEELSDVIESMVSPGTNLKMGYFKEDLPHEDRLQ